MARLDLRALHCFYKVATVGSFTRAAEALHVTQSAVSHSVRGLEKRVGFPLFVRGRTLQLTEFGQIVFDFATRIFTISDELDAFARARLSRYKCPSDYQIVEQLPLAPTGKPVRRELR